MNITRIIYKNKLYLAGSFIDVLIHLKKLESNHETLLELTSKTFTK